MKNSPICSTLLSVSTEFSNEFDAVMRMTWEEEWQKKFDLFGKFTMEQSLNPPDASTLIFFITEEERVTSILNVEEILTNTNHFIAVIVHHDQFNPQNKKFIESVIQRLRKYTDQNNKRLDVIKFDTFAPDIKEIKNSLIENNFYFKTDVLVDITGCPSSTLIPLTILLFDNIQFTLTFSYTMAKTYDLEKISRRDDLDAENYLELKIYDENSQEKKNRPKMLFVIIGHENKKSAVIKRFIKPKHGIIFNNVFSPSYDKAVDIALEATKLHSDFILKDKFGQFNLSRHDLPIIYATIDGFFQRYEDDYDIVIGPFGSKIQRLATIIMQYDDKKFSMVDIIPKIIYQDPITEGFERTLYYTFRKM